MPQSMVSYHDRVLYHSKGRLLVVGRLSHTGGTFLEAGRYRGMGISLAPPRGITYRNSRAGWVLLPSWAAVPSVA